MSRRRLHGFTLIELLVVIAIIALLMSILMPVLGKAKKQAGNVVCQSNLRQIGVAASLFAHDHDNKIPRANDQQLATPRLETSRWFLSFMRYLSQSPKDGDYRSVKIYRCPAYPVKEHTVCFVVNGFSANGGEAEGFTSTMKIKQKAKRIYLADYSDVSDSPNWIVQSVNDHEGLTRTDAFHQDHLGASLASKTQRQGRRVAQRRHREGYNALFLDGHVAYLKIEPDVKDSGDRVSAREELFMWDWTDTHTFQ